MKMVQAPHPQYKPNKNIVTCKDPKCADLHWPSEPPCEKPQDQCDYEIGYADEGSTLGVLVTDFFSLHVVGGTSVSPRMAFGYRSYPPLTLSLV